MIKAIDKYMEDLTTLPGLAGFEQRVALYMSAHFTKNGFQVRSDTFGNCIASLEGTDATAPVVMVFAHMDSLGFLVRYIEDGGFIRIERLGGIPEKVLPATEIQIQCRDGSMVNGVIGAKAHHVTPPEEKYIVDKYTKLFVDIGAKSREEVLALGIDVGSPIIYKPRYQRLLKNKILASFCDNRSGCATLLALSDLLCGKPQKSTIYLVGTVQEEYNLRGAMMASRSIHSDVAICIDGGLGGDTPDLRGQTSAVLGGGPVLSHYNFHGRGTLNGTIPHPRMLALMEQGGRDAGIPLQRRASIGGLTDMAYLQLEKDGIIGVDVGAPRRYTHCPCEVMDLGDIVMLTKWVYQCLTYNLKGYDFKR